jgi:hypothetical protein
MYQEHDMDMALTQYMDKIQDSYSQWSKGAARLQIRFDRGSKFYKCVVDTSAHSFICRKAHDKWQVGDVLKAATWSAPAKNFIRGNVLTQQYNANFSWAGL